MARAIWTGSISFGLVNIPVGLYSAVSERSIRFNQLQKGTSDRIRYKRVNERTGEEVGYRDIVKGYDVGGSQYVVVTDEELEAIEPSGSRTIEIEDFVDAVDIDPIFYNQTYYVAPRTEAAARPYALLIEAMRQSGKTAVAMFVMRSREHLAALRVHGEVLALETMYFADEIRDPMAEIEIRPTAEPPSERELATAVLLIESMGAKWEPERYRDRYRARVEQLIEQKLQGAEVVTATSPEPDANVVDLMEALRRSVDRVRDDRGAGRDSVAAGASPKGTGIADHAVARSGSGETPHGARRPARGRSAADAPAAEKPARRAKRSSKKGRLPQGEQLAMMSRDELYQLAQDIQLPGRSKMNRDELADAVANARAARQAS
ncbi:MAG TPA: Ku protein [Acidimicrobiales bacterium]|nr:Ku protein [Acidimicrobiales bacterium]